MLIAAGSAGVKDTKIKAKMGWKVCEINRKWNGFGILEHFCV